MGVNKVVFGAVAIMDISDSTVTEETLAKGVTAYRADGEKITGKMEPSSDPALQEKTVSPSTSKQTVTPDSGYDGLSKVNVNAMPTATQATPSITVSSAGLITAKSTQSAGYVAAGTKQSTKQLTTQAAKTVTPSTADQTAVASGRYTTGAVTVKGDANLVAGNIKKGVSIFGVTGTVESGVDTSDATATADEIFKDKTAYVNGAKVTGTFPSGEIDTQASLISQIQTALQGKAAGGGGGSVETCSVTYNDGGLCVGAFYIDGNLDLQFLSTDDVSGGIFSLQNVLKGSYLYVMTNDSVDYSCENTEAEYVSEVGYMFHTYKFEITSNVNILG